MLPDRAEVMHVMAVVFAAVTVQLLLPNVTATALMSSEKPADKVHELFRSA
jgi:hypothetical protein